MLEESNNFQSYLLRLGNSKILEALISHGALINPPDTEDGTYRSPLWNAVFALRYSMIIYLLEKGAHIDFANSELNPLSYITKNLSTLVSFNLFSIVISFKEKNKNIFSS